MFCSSFLAFFIILLSLNVGQIDSLKLTIALFMQMLPGIYLWGKIHKRGQIPFSEMIGMGLAIGTLLAIISGALLRTLPLGEFSWIAPFLLTIFSVVIKKDINLGKRSSATTYLNILQVRGFLFMVSILAYTQLYVWSRWQALNPKGWWKYHVDVPYFEALSNSIALFGTSNSLMKPDLETRYHWFAYAWIGMLNQSLEVDPFVVQTRLLPLVTMIMAASIAFAWTKDFTDRAFSAAIASLLVVLGPGFAIGSLVMLRSPSSAMAAGWTLAFSLLFFRCLRASRVEAMALLALCLLSIGVVAGKGINLLIVGSAVFTVLLSHLLLKKTLSKVESKVFLVVFLSLIATYFFLIHTSEGRSLKFSIYLGWPALMLTVLPLSLGLILGSSKKSLEHRSLMLYSIGALSVGALLSLVTNVYSGDQIYFAICALTLCIIPSVILAEKSFQNGGRDLIQSIETSIPRPKLIKFSSVFILVTGLIASGTWIFFENTPNFLGDVGRAVAPSLIWVFAIMGSLILLKRKNVHRQNFKSITIVLILSMSVTSTSIGLLASIVRGPIYADNEGYAGYGKSLPTNPGSVSSNYFKAGDWVKRNTNPKERFFTNRQCLDSKSGYKNCLDLWFFASAISGRQYLIEGGAFNIIDADYKIKMNEEQIVSLRFSLNPNLSDLHYLWSRDVRWGWIDKMVVERANWFSFATTVYSNDDIAIIRLMDPKEFEAASK